MLMQAFAELVPQMITNQMENIFRRTPLLAAANWCPNERDFCDAADVIMQSSLTMPDIRIAPAARRHRSENRIGTVRSSFSSGMLGGNGGNGWARSIIETTSLSSSR